MTLSSTPEDITRELERVTEDGAAIIVDSGVSSFGIARENAGR